MDLTLFSAGIAVTGLLVAGLIKGATGLGYTTCALPFLVAGLGLKPAMALVVAPAMASNVFLLLDIGQLRPTFNRFRMLYLAMVAGIAYGVMLLTWIDARHATRVLGLLTLAYVAFALLHPRLSLPERLERPLQLPTGLLNGVLTGLTGSQILPLVPYLMSLRLAPDQFVQAANISVTLSSLTMALGLGMAGVLTLPLAVLSIAGILPALIGTNLGNRLRPRIPVPAFRALVLAILGLMGLAMLLR